mmetsp:Transcript_2302/g.2979  ORF Transcript_2302/g.2979 Transcript_2302/m.2979 type:complete len:89 (-) Transcript_2302:16-282(-)
MIFWGASWSTGMPTRPVDVLPFPIPGIIVARDRIVVLLERERSDALLPLLVAFVFKWRPMRAIAKRDDAMVGFWIIRAQRQFCQFLPT